MRTFTIKTCSRLTLQTRSACYPVPGRKLSRAVAWLLCLASIFPPPGRVYHLGRERWEVQVFDGKSSRWVPCHIALYYLPSPLHYHRHDRANTINWAKHVQRVATKWTQSCSTAAFISLGYCVVLFGSRFWQAEFFKLLTINRPRRSPHANHSWSSFHNLAKARPMERCIHVDGDHHECSAIISSCHRNGFLSSLASARPIQTPAIFDVPAESTLAI